MTCRKVRYKDRETARKALRQYQKAIVRRGCGVWPKRVYACLHCAGAYHITSEMKRVHA